MHSGTDDTKTGTMPPQAIDFEEATIGALLLQPELLSKVDYLNQADFYSSRCGLIYTQICNLDREGKPIDAITVSGELERIGAFEDVGGAFATLQCMEKTQNTHHIEYYAQKIVETSKRRRAIQHTRDLNERLHDPQADFDTVLAEAGEFRDSLITGGDAFEFITSEELLNSDEEIEYLVNGLLVAGQPCILAGPKKCLKTNLMIDLTLSISSGSKFLGKFGVPKAVKVAIMSGESGQATIKETAKRIADSKYLGLETFADVFWMFDLPKFGDAVQERQLERFIEKNEIKVLMIDPAYLCLPIGNDAGNLFMVGEILQGIGRIGQRTGCTILLAHHTTKSSAVENTMPELADIAWSGFQEWARQWILLGRREKYDPDQGGHHKLWFNAGGSAGHSQAWSLDINEGTRDDEGGRRWEVDVISVSEAQKADISKREDNREQSKSIRKENDLQKIIDQLAQYPDGLTINQLKPKLEWGYEKVKSNLAILCEREVAEKVEITMETNKQKYDGFRLTETTVLTRRDSVRDDGDSGISSSVSSLPLGGETEEDDASRRNGDGSLNFEWMGDF